MAVDRTARGDAGVAAAAVAAAPLRPRDPRLRGPKVFHAAPPAAQDHGVAERAERIQRELQDLLGELLDRAAGAAGDRPGHPAAIRGLQSEYEIDDCIRSACESATGEVMLAIPGGARPRPALAEAASLHLAALRRGVRTRILLQHTVRFDQAAREHVQVATAAGSQFRTLDELFRRFVVVDAETVIMEADEARTEAVAVSHPIVAQFAAAAFEQSWSRAIRFEPAGPADPAAAVGDEIREAIKRLVAEGMTDSQIGRRVGLKPRAVQNRIRQIKQEMGVESRSELCFLLGRRFDDGWGAKAPGLPAGPTR